MARYTQFLGNLDPLGWLNSWGNPPEQRLFTHHSTNTAIPLSMPVAILSRFALTEEAPSGPALLSAPLPSMTISDATASLVAQPAS